MNNIIIWSVVIVAVLFVGFFFYSALDNTDSSLQKGISEQKINSVANGEFKEFRIEAFQFGFNPDVIEVNQGDTVKIIAFSSDVPHGLSIPEYGVNLYLDGLKEQTVEFVADKKGTFVFACSVPCGSGHSRMRGRLIVN